MSKFTSYSRKTEACPICSEHGKGCKSLSSTSNADVIIFCRKVSNGTQVPGHIYLGESDNGLWQRYKEGEPSVGFTLEQTTAYYAERYARKAQEAEYERLSKITIKQQATPSEQRDRHYRNLIQSHQVTAEHRAKILERKGMTDDRIAEIGAFSKRDYRGVMCLYIPSRDINGLMNGAQFKDFNEKGYKWDNAGNNKIAETGDLPLTVWGNRTNPDRIVLVEGIGFKPYLTSKIFFKALVIGAAGGQFASSKEELCDIVMRYPDIPIILMPDAGAVFNSGVSSQYASANEVIVGLGRLLSVGWWKQFYKPTDGDIDEIDLAKTKIIEKTFEQYQRIAHSGCEYKKLTRLTGQTEIRDERYLSPLPELKRGEMTFVSSPVGTGKTTILKLTIEEWLRIHPDGKIVFVGHRNSLLNQMCNTLNVPSYRVGNGLEETFINGEPKVAIVVDSLGLLKVEELPEHVLIVIDESEGVLKHITLGGTTGNRTSKIQAHLTAVINRVMATGGHLLGLEDSLTDLSIKGVKDLTSNKYKVNIIENQYEAFKYVVKMGGNNDFKHFISALILRLKAGDRIALATTSQRFGECVQKAIGEYIPGIKIERLDATTIEKLGDLIKNPVEYLRESGCQLVIYSPTVESGFNIDDKGENPLFDAMFAYFVNLDTRAHIQMLSRYRSNCPRYIYTNKKGAEQSALANSPTKLDRVYQRIANQTSLEQGNGRIKMSADGLVWNRLVAEFECRSHYSAQYLHEYLRINLLDRGHDVSVIDWQSEVIELSTKYGIDAPDSGEIADRYGEIKIELLDRDAKVLYEANGNIPIELADNWLHSTYATNEQKIRAKKAKLHERLPGMEFSYEFIREVVIEDSGAYLKQCEFRYLIDKPSLSKELDRLIFAKQLEQGHIIYKSVPKNSQRVRLITEVAKLMASILQRGDFRNDSEDAIELRAFAIKRWGDFHSLFGLTMREDMSVNTIASKIFKKVGYVTERHKSLDRSKKGDDTYVITNRDCQHAKDIEAALERRYAKIIEGLSVVSDSIKSNIESADMAMSEGSECTSEEICGLLRIVIADPNEYPIYRSVISRENLIRGSKLLSDSERSILKNIVTEYNKQAA